MGRGKATLVVASVCFVSSGGAAVVVWQTRAHHVPLFYVVGGLAGVVGPGMVESAVCGDVAGLELQPTTDPSTSSTSNRVTGKAPSSSRPSSGTAAG